MFIRSATPNGSHFASDGTLGLVRPFFDADRSAVRAGRLKTVCGFPLPDDPRGKEIMGTDLTNLSFGELRAMLPSTDGIELPKVKALMKSTSGILINLTLDDNEITVFKNGFFLYRNERRATVYAVDRCKSMTWDFVSGESTTVDESNYMNCIWYIPLMIVGDDRIFRNIDSKESSITGFSMDEEENESENWNRYLIEPEFNEKAEQEEIAKEQEEREALLLKNLPSALEALTEKQRTLITLYYFEHLSEREIGKRFGMTQQAVSKGLERARKKMKKILEKI